MCSCWSLVVGNWDTLLCWYLLMSLQNVSQTCPLEGERQKELCMDSDQASSCQLPWWWGTHEAESEVSQISIPATSQLKGIVSSAILLSVPAIAFWSSTGTLTNMGFPWTQEPRGWAACTAAWTNWSSSLAQALLNASSFLGHPVNKMDSTTISGINCCQNLNGPTSHSLFIKLSIFSCPRLLDSKKFTEVSDPCVFRSVCTKEKKKEKENMYTKAPSIMSYQLISAM